MSLRLYSIIHFIRPYENYKVYPLVYSTPVQNCFCFVETHTRLRQLNVYCNVVCAVPRTGKDFEIVE